MATWLTRSLLLIVAGAVLAFAVTVHVRVIDLQTTGVILLLVGIFDLLLNVGLSLYLHEPLGPIHVHPLDHRAATNRPQPSPPPALLRRDTRRPVRAYPELSDDDTYPTRPLRRHPPDWH